MHWHGGVGKLGSQNRELDQDERRNSRLGRKSQRRPASPFAPAVACHQVKVLAPRAKEVSLALPGSTQIPGSTQNLVGQRQ
jgi:hypothetical protein